MDLAAIKLKQHCINIQNVARICRGLCSKNLLVRFQDSHATLFLLFYATRETHCHWVIVHGCFAKKTGHQSQTCIAHLRCNKDADEAIACQRFIFFVFLFAEDVYADEFIRQFFGENFQRGTLWSCLIFFWINSNSYNFP